MKCIPSCIRRLIYQQADLAQAGHYRLTGDHVTVSNDDDQAFMALQFGYALNDLSADATTQVCATDTAPPQTHQVRAALQGLFSNSRSALDSAWHHFRSLPASAAGEPAMQSAIDELNKALDGMAYAAGEALRSNDINAGEGHPGQSSTVKRMVMPDDLHSDLGETVWDSDGTVALADLDGRAVIITDKGAAKKAHMLLHADSDIPFTLAWSTAWAMSANEIKPMVRLALAPSDSDGNITQPQGRHLRYGANLIKALSDEIEQCIRYNMDTSGLSRWETDVEDCINMRDVLLKKASQGDLLVDDAVTDAIQSLDEGALDVQPTVSRCTKAQLLVVGIADVARERSRSHWTARSARTTLMADMSLTLTTISHAMPRTASGSALSETGRARQVKGPSWIGT